jgi:tRNA (guanine-N7-)-methyltransferase
MDFERRIRTYALRLGKISPAQKRSYDALFPIFGIKGDETGTLDCQLIFGNERPLIIEIGFGMGTATAEIADKNPENNYLAIDVHKPGIGRLLWNIEKQALNNIRIIEGDAVDIIMRRIKDNSVSAFHIFFPDPWPKKRHHKRRLVKRPFTDLLAAKLLPGAYVYMVSDWEDYGNQAIFELSVTPGLVNKYDAFAEHQSWRPETEFERKGIQKNHKIWELFFVKNGK